MNVILCHEGKPHRMRAMAKLAEGILAHGDDAYLVKDWGETAARGLKVSWGARGGDLLLEAGYINGDSGDYTADRLQHISVSWTNLHGLSLGFSDPCPGDRWEKLGIPLQAWRTDGEYCLVLDQHPLDSGAPPQPYWADEIRNVSRLYQVRMRRHPLQGEVRSLEDDLADAHTAFTWASNAAVESVIAGVPTITLSQSSIAWPVTMHDINGPRHTVDRLQWAYNLAYRQWTLDELASGEAWEYIRESR